MRIEGHIDGNWRIYLEPIDISELNNNGIISGKPVSAITNLAKSPNHPNEIGCMVIQQTETDLQVMSRAIQFARENPDKITLTDNRPIQQ